MIDQRTKTKARVLKILIIALGSVSSDFVALSSAERGQGALLK